MGQIQETQLAPGGSGGTLTSAAKSLPQPAGAVAIQFEVEAVAGAAPASPSATSAVTSGTQPIATYFYEVAAVSAAGLESAVSTEVHSTISTSTGSTTISWSTVSGSASYKIYVNATSSGAEARYYSTTAGSSGLFLDDNSKTAVAGTPLATTPTVTWKAQGSFDNRNFYDIPYVTEATAVESQVTATYTSAGAHIRWVALGPTRFFPLYRVVVTTAVASQLTYNVTAFSLGV